MKIIEKPTIKSVTCNHCGCIFQPKHRNLKCSMWSYYKDACYCPFCGKINEVKFDKSVENKLGEALARLSASAERNLAGMKQLAEKFKAYDPNWMEQDGK